MRLFFSPLPILLRQSIMASSYPQLMICQMNPGAGIHYPTQKLLPYPKILYIKIHLSTDQNIFSEIYQVWEYGRIMTNED